MNFEFNEADAQQAREEAGQYWDAYKKEVDRLINMDDDEEKTVVSIKDYSLYESVLDGLSKIGAVEFISDNNKGTKELWRKGFCTYKNTCYFYSPDPIKPLFSNPQKPAF